MSQNHRYILQPYKSLSDRYTCPACNEKKKFSRYIDTSTNEHLADDCGRCERTDGCGYHFTPSDYFKENPTNKPLDFEKWTPVPAPPPRPVSFIDKAIFKKTLGVNHSNTFTNFLIALFGKERAENLINKYHISTTKNAETIFYQVDLQGNVRSGKVMKYNITDSTQTALGTDCKRDKTAFPNWVHSKLKLENFNLSQCLFGEHLLTDSRTVAIVESEKSAVIASVYFPSFVWVACGGKEGLGIDKLKVLKGKSVILFPDLNGFDKWNLKAVEMRAFCKSVAVSDLLEQVATDEERASGLDLADYLLRLPPPQLEIPVISKIETTDNEPASTVTTDTHKSVSDNCEVLLSDNCEVVETDLIEEVPFLEEIPQISDDEFKIKCEVLDWWNIRLDLFEEGSTMVIDGIAVPDINSVFPKHVKAIHNDNSSAVLSLKFLEKVKNLILPKIEEQLTDY
jgi:Domain of unknown function (DUF6371)